MGGKGSSLSHRITGKPDKVGYFGLYKHSVPSYEEWLPTFQSVKKELQQLGITTSISLRDVNDPYTAWLLHIFPNRKTMDAYGEIFDENHPYIQSLIAERKVSGPLESQTFMMTGSIGWTHVHFKPGWMIGVVGHGVRNFTQWEKTYFSSEPHQTMLAGTGIVRAISGLSIEKTRDDHDGAVTLEAFLPIFRDQWIANHRDPDLLLQQPIREGLVYSPISTRLFEISHVIYPMERVGHEE